MTQPTMNSDSVAAAALNAASEDGSYAPTLGDGIFSNGGSQRNSLISMLGMDEALKQEVLMYAQHAGMEAVGDVKQMLINTTQAVSDRVGAVEANLQQLATQATEALNMAREAHAVATASAAAARTLQGPGSSSQQQVLALQGKVRLEA